MGKKQGQAQRVKGNVQPSSSAKAAEMLQLVGSNLSNYGLGVDMSTIGVGTLMEDSFDSNLDGDFRMVLKKLYKKDVFTKQKALEELKSLIETKSNDECLAIISYWSKLYTKLCLDNDRKIRELCQQTHEKYCGKVNKNIAPHLKTIMPYWILAQSDTHLAASRIAENSFKSTFSEAKQPEVVYFAKDEILNILHDYIIEQTPKTLSDMKTTSEDEALQKYETVISICFRGFDLFLKYYLSSLGKQLKSEENPKESSAIRSLEKLEKIFSSQKFWRFSRENSLKIRGEFFQLLNSLIDLFIINKDLIELEKLGVEKLNELRKFLKVKLVPMVFYACDEDNNVCAFYAWQSILKCVNLAFDLEESENGQNFWSLLNVKKAFVPKLISLLRSHGNGNANFQNIDFIFAALRPLVEKLTKAFEPIVDKKDEDEKIIFFKDFFAKLFDIITKETSTVNKLRINAANARSKVVDAFFDCLTLISQDLIKKNRNVDFFQQVYTSHVLPLVVIYLDQSSNQANDGLESKFQQFLDETIENSDYSSIKEKFWLELNKLVLAKFDEQSELDLNAQLSQAQSQLNLIQNLSKLFSSFWQKNQANSKSTNLFNLTQIIFSKCLNKFKQITNRDDFKTSAEPPTFNTIENLTCAYLKCLNSLLKNFTHKNLIHSLKSNLCTQAETEQFIDDLIIQVYQRYDANSAQKLKKLIIFNLIDLYLIVKNDDTTDQKLDYYLFEIGNSSIDLTDLLEYYFELKKETRIFTWFSNSKQFKSKFLGLLNEIKLNFKIDSFVFNLLAKFVDNVSELEFYNEVVKTILSLFKSSVEQTLNSIQNLNDLIRFSVEILFLRKNNLSLNCLWELLINCCCLRQKRKSLLANNELDKFIKKLSQTLFDLIKEKSSTAELFKELTDFDPLRTFINDNVENYCHDLTEYFRNESILLDLIAQFLQILNNKNDNMNQFYQKILLPSNFTQHFQQTFTHLTKSHKNHDLLINVYLNDDLNQVYSEYYSSILTSSDVVFDEKFFLTSLKKLNFSLKIMNNCPVDKVDAFFNDEARFYWYYLILSSYLLSEHLEPASLFRLGEKNNAELKIQLQKSVKFELDAFLRKFNILEMLLNNEPLFDQFQNLIQNDLNSASLLIYLITEKNSDLTSLVKRFVDKLNDAELNDRFFHLSLIKLENGFDYERFKGLFDSALLKMKNLFNDLKSTCVKYDDLKQFNLNFNRIIKISKFYLKYLRESMKESCSEFRVNFLTKNLIDVFDFMIDLKTHTKNYSFYFSFNSDELLGNIETEWEKLNFLNSLNLFLALFFIDFKHENCMQQTSQHLKDKHWDFLLCYTASLIQQLNKLNMSDLIESVRMQLLTVNYFSLAFELIRSIQMRVRFNKVDIYYPSSIYSEWVAFFAKEIFDPFLCVYVKITNYYADFFNQQTKKNTTQYLSILMLKSRKQEIVRGVCSVVSLIPVERLIFNELEAKFNVMDLDLESDGAKTQIKFTDQIKTVINHLVPDLRHGLSSVQLSAYKVLRVLMRSASGYYAGREESELASEEDEGKAKGKSIYDSLPFVIRETLTELTLLFSDVKNSVEFDENILVSRIPKESDEVELDVDLVDIDNNAVKLSELRHEANNKLMSFLFISRLILDLFNTNDLTFKVKLANDLRQINFCDNLMHCLFRLMPRVGKQKYFMSNLMLENEDPDFVDFEAIVNEPLGSEEWLKQSSSKHDETFSNFNVEMFACKLYKYALRCIPAMMRDWWNSQSKRVSDQVDRYTAKFVSPVLVDEEIKEVNRSALYINNPARVNEPVMVEVGSGNAKKSVAIEEDEQSTIKIRGMCSSREIVSTYKMKELSMELVIQLPVNYPLGVVEVSSVRRLGVSENEWRNWLIQLTTYLTHQNGSIIQGLQIWKRNVDKKFSGVEECTICYNVIHGTNYQLPKKKCRTCRKLFHSICLYKWFESSSKSTCPLCRNLF